MPDTAADDQVLSKPPVFSEDPHTDTQIKTKLRLESVLEVETVLSTVPHDERGALLQSVMQGASDDIQRTLEYYREMNAALDEKLSNMDVSIVRCGQIKAELEKSSSEYSQQAEMALLVKRIKNCNRVFRMFKEQFSKLLVHIDNRMPDMKLSDVLQVLCNRVMDTPNDPYMEMYDLECSDEALVVLLRLSLVQRHSHDPTKIKLLDPRK